MKKLSNKIINRVYDEFKEADQDLVFFVIDAVHIGYYDFTAEYLLDIANGDKNRLKELYLSHIQDYRHFESSAKKHLETKRLYKLYNEIMYKDLEDPPLAFYQSF